MFIGTKELTRIKTNKKVIPKNHKHTVKSGSKNIPITNDDFVYGGATLDVIYCSTCGELWPTRLHFTGDKIDIFEDL